jgi:hypothetical protein
VLKEDFDLLFCSHRGVVENGRDALTRKLDNLVALCDQVRELHDTGLGVRQITRKLLGREDQMAVMTRGHFSRRNLIASCLASGNANRTT